MDSNASSLSRIPRTGATHNMAVGIGLTEGKNRNETSN